MKHVFIIGHYGGDNFGDEAMLDALVYHLIKEKKFETIKIVSKSDKPSVFKHPNVIWIPNKVSQIAKSVLNTQYLILGGGTHFHDDYNDARYKNHKWYLLRIIIVSSIYRLLNRKVLYLGVGYGPFFRKSAKVLTRISCQLANHIRVRDNLSMERLEQIGVFPGEKIKNAFDLAALHPAFGLTGNATFDNYSAALGISVTSLNFSKGVVNDSFWHEKVFPVIAQWYQENSEEKVKVFVLRGGERESDFTLSNSLFSMLEQIDPERVQLVDFTYDTESYIEEIKTCKQFIATRYHSAVLAYLAGCELLIIPYHEKLIAFANYIQLSEKAVIIPNGNQDFSEIFNVQNFCRPRLDRTEANTLAQANLQALML